MILPIKTGVDNPILRAKSLAVKKFDKKLKQLILDMAETMLVKDGVGLAAPQIGVNLRLIVLHFQLSAKESRILPMINPEITQASPEQEVAEEGCLSLPEIFGKVSRAELVTVRFQNESGKNQMLSLEGINARAIQHEIDHLDGVLFVDRIEL